MGPFVLLTQSTLDSDFVTLAVRVSANSESRSLALTPW